MSKKIKNLEKYYIRILCEDNEHYHFTRGFLTALGANERKFKPLRSPKGRGSGEQFVRENFDKEYNSYAIGKENKLLVVIRDVDVDKYNTPFKEMKATLLKGKSDVSKLIVVFSKRNIETWFEWIENPEITPNETKDYKNKHRNAKAGQLGKKASEFYINGEHCETAPASINFARAELETLSL